MIRKLCFITLLSLSLVFGQDIVYKPHADQQAQWGKIDIAQETEQLSFSQDLAKKGQVAGPSHVVFGYHPYWNGTAWLNYNYDIISHLAWFGLSMTASGSIDNTHGWPLLSLVDKAHSKGVKVIVTVTLFDDDAIATLLGNASYRQNAIDNLIAAVSQGNADGVNIDFEFVKIASREHFKVFIYDLTQAFHDQIPGSEVSIAMPSVDWWGSYDYKYLSDNSDGLMIMAYGYYYSGSSNAGPLSPLNSGMSSWHIKRTVEKYLSDTGGDGSQLILGLPWYGIDFPVTGTQMGASVVADQNGSSIFYYEAEPEALSNDKQYNAEVHSAWYNYNNGNDHQVWYDDSLSLAAKYAYAKDKGIKGIGIWALGYDGGRAEIWGGLNDAFGAFTPPLVSPYFSVSDADQGTIAVRCATSSYTDLYEVYTSVDGISFIHAKSSSTPDFTFENVNNDALLFVKIRNTNSFGSSNYSEVLGVAPKSTGKKVLIVQGFERVAGTVNLFDYIIEHGNAVHANGYRFDAASNDAVESGAISLIDYDIVDWISGEEATGTVSFSLQEQTRIEEYLESGGALFVSGSEIGWDLQASGNDSDKEFYQNYFKADYIVDDAQSYSTIGTTQGIFSSITSATFDNGTMGTYDVDYPDGIKPMGGALSNLQYSGADYTSNGGAGIQYLGTFGSGNAVGGIVYLGVGFETFYPESTRNAMMGDVLEFLSDAVLSSDEFTVLPERFSISNVYPNPFNSDFSFTIMSEESMDANIIIFDILGKEVYRASKQIEAGENTLIINAFSNTPASSGVYFLQVENNFETSIQSITYLK